MPRFPESLPEIMALASEVAGGMEQNPADYPAPPVTPAELKQNRADIFEVESEIVALRASLTAARTRKRELVKNIKRNTTSNLRYAEALHRKQPAKLLEINWRVRAAPKKLEKPEQAMNLKIVFEENGGLKLAWKKPVGGGKVAAYQIMRRNITENTDYQLAGASVNRFVELTDQPQGVKLEYRIIAINRTGESVPSNSVYAVL